MLKVNVLPLGQSANQIGIPPPTKKDERAGGYQKDQERARALFLRPAQRRRAVFLNCLNNRWHALSSLFALQGSKQGFNQFVVMGLGNLGIGSDLQSLLFIVARNERRENNDRCVF